jgi:riboflavin kinase/FMN adenylyltransferase
MVVVPGIDALTADLGRLFVVVGVFDGLHLGHAYLLAELERAAATRNARPAVITFDHHPDEILLGSAPPLLCDPEERLARLQAAGVEVTIVQHFDVALRMTPFDAFIHRIADRVDLAGILMTPESAFGHERRGTPEAVAELGQTMGYDVVVVPSLDLDGEPVTSSKIRAAIADGRLRDAERLLGRPYSVVGERADRRESELELTFPMPVALPPPGEYRVGIVGPSTVDGIATGSARPASARRPSAGPAWARVESGRIVLTSVDGAHPGAAPAGDRIGVQFHEAAATLA